jgi:uncharacterized membrane protein YdjX (TVP38/TMEM64 family)
VNEPEFHSRRSASANAFYIGAAIACVVLTVLPFTMGPQFADAIDGLIIQAQRGHIGFPVAIAFFTIASFIGAPQPLLVGACVLAAGAMDGFWYAWVGTTVAGCANYAVGHAFHGYAKDRVDGFAKWRWMSLIRRKPFVASLLIRSVPTVPFVVVNMAFGVARVDFWRFLAGFVLGSVPKIAIIAFAGKGVLDVIRGDLGWSVLVAAAIVAAWIGVGYLLKKRAQKLEENEPI